MWVDASSACLSALEAMWAQVGWSYTWAEKSCCELQLGASEPLRSEAGEKCHAKHHPAFFGFYTFTLILVAGCSQKAGWSCLWVGLTHLPWFLVGSARVVGWGHSLFIIRLCRCTSTKAWKVTRSWFTWAAEGCESASLGEAGSCSQTNSVWK